MQIAYDFHIHTVASPCADRLMTPHNIVNMSLLKGLDVIAITDHQTMANCESVMKVGAEKGLLVIPGIEIECMEEFHLIALFPTLEKGKMIEERIKNNLPPIKNRKDLFGEQWIVNDQEEQVGEIEQLLLTATQISVDDLVKEVLEQSGVIYPAHIDRSSYSILTNLGGIPKNLDFNALEISQNVNYSHYQEIYNNYTIIQSSDAHYLIDIAERKRVIEVERKEINGIIEKLNKTLA